MIYVIIILYILKDIYIKLVYSKIQRFENGNYIYFLDSNLVADVISEKGQYSFY